MNHESSIDWDPNAESVQTDQRAAYDAMRECCPVAYSDYSGWSLFRHRDIERVLHDPETFSNGASHHLSVPNGMDPPEHTTFRAMIKPYLSAERVQAHQPHCRQLAHALLDEALAQENVEVMSQLARRFAVQTQCAYLGWPATMHDALLDWVARNQEATRCVDRPQLSALAREFAGYVNDVLQSRRHAEVGPDSDITTCLLNESVNGRFLQEEEVTSIMRNWTVGEVGSLSASVGIMVHQLATDAALQKRLRCEPERLPDAIEEMLRLNGPLATNRRITTRPVVVGGRQLEAGARISINWVAADRDGRAFEDPATLDIDRDQANNLLWGAGIHVCPGAPLARMEMRTFMEVLLERTESIALDDSRAITMARLPASGFEVLPVCLR